MKLNKVFAALMAVVTLVAFSACNKESQDVIKLKLNKANLTVGQTYTVPVEKASGDITWTSSNEAVATVDAQGTITAVAEGSSAVKATVGKASATVDVTVTAGGQTGGAPDLDAPAEGKLLIVIEIPAGTECNGIALKGTFDGSAWSGENTYLGEDGAQTPVDGKIYKFEAIKDYANWYKVEIPMTEALEFKVCLIYAGDGSWQGQGEDVALHSCNYSSVAPKIDGGQCKEFNATTGLLYLSIGKWHDSECAVKVEHDYVISVKVPTCSDVTPELVGEFDGWSGTALTKDGEVWKANVHAWEGCEFKVRESSVGKADDAKWNNQIQYYVPADLENDVKATWADAQNSKLGSELNVTLDFSDGEQYRWTVCGAE